MVITLKTEWRNSIYFYWSHPERSDPNPFKTNMSPFYNCPLNQQYKPGITQWHLWRVSKRNETFTGYWHQIGVVVFGWLFIYLFIYFFKLFCRNGTSRFSLKDFSRSGEEEAFVSRPHSLAHRFDFRNISKLFNNKRWARLLKNMADISTR